MSTLAWAASLPYQGVARLRQRRSQHWPALPRPSISVGNLAFGGRGKTPLTAIIAQQARARGLRPAILTRGYGGTVQPTDSPVILKGSEGAPWLQPVAQQRARCGEEACWLAARCSGAPVAVHPDRLLAAQELLQLGAIDLFVLDDAFQTPLQRDLDLVLLDARLDPPYASGPGPLREGPSALERASFLGVFTVDGEPLPRFTTARSGLPDLPCFALQRRFGRLRRLSDGAPIPQASWPSEVIVAAAVGQPGSVLQILASKGIRAVETLALRDHQGPRRAALGGLQRSDLPILITEKDAIGWARQSLAEALVLELRIEGAEALATALLGELLP
jgi:tetraacyldisaccharide 4'-kinase